MLRRIYRRLFRRPRGKVVEVDADFRRFVYSNYDAYRRAQIEANHRKLHKVSVYRENIDFLADYIRSAIGPPSFGLCHGTRRGLEQGWFSERLGCRVIGTEISDTAEQFPNTIQWDFHEVKPEWIGAVDFIYSNAFDHANDPAQCLNAWMSCLRPKGLLLMEQHKYLVSPNETDPTGITLDRLIQLAESEGHRVRDVMPTLTNPEYLFFIVLERTG